MVYTEIMGAVKWCPYAAALVGVSAVVGACCMAAGGYYSVGYEYGAGTWTVG